MSIETQLEELNQIKTNIFTSIGNKGVVVPENPGLKDAAGLIDSIPTGGGSDLPTDLFKGCLKLNTSQNNCSIQLDSTKLQINENSIVKAKFFIIGGYSGWGSDFNLLDLEPRDAQGITVRFRNNTNTNTCIAEFREMYNNSDFIETSPVSALSIEIGLQESLWNGSNVYGYNGRKSNRLVGNGISKMFSWGGGSGDYSGSVFYELTIEENGVIKHKLIPAKKSNNSIIIIDLITLDEYDVDINNYQFIEQ